MDRVPAHLANRRGSLAWPRLRTPTVLSCRSPALFKGARSSICTTSTEVHSRLSRLQRVPTMASSNSPARRSACGEDLSPTPTTRGAAQCSSPLLGSDAPGCGPATPNPLKFAEITTGPGRGHIGITLAPGKKQTDAMSGAWDRDLKTDLDAIAAWDVVMVTLLEHHELDAISCDGAEPPDPTQRCSKVILEYHFGKGVLVLPVEPQVIPRA